MSGLCPVVMILMLTVKVVVVIRVIGEGDGGESCDNGWQC